jgi:hypothetical protein
MPVAASYHQSMARPKEPLVEPTAVAAKALELIDRLGVEAFNLRRLAVELGVSHSSLYHHFDGKDDILRRVCWLVIEEGDVVPPAIDGRTWQEYVKESAIRYHRALMRHPQVAPVLTPSIQEQRFKDPVGQNAMSRLQADGVPRRLVYAVVDSVNTLAYGSAMLNARSAAREQDAQDRPARTQSRRSGPPSPDRLFRMQLEALLQGWTTIIESSRSR